MDKLWACWALFGIFIEREVSLNHTATMFHALSNVQRGEAVLVYQFIDNRVSKLMVRLRFITYTVGWHNVGTAESFSVWFVGAPREKD